MPASRAFVSASVTLTPASALASLPPASVTLASILPLPEKPRFVVGGEVEKPGQFELRGRISLLEALAMAGGVKRSAKHTQVLIFRRFDEDHVVTRVVDAKRLAKAGRVQEDPYLRPGDLIFVPQNKFSKVERLVPLASIGWLLGWVW